MTPHYWESEKSAAIGTEIEERGSNLPAGGSACLWGMHSLTFLPGSESILAGYRSYGWAGLFMLTQET